MTTLAIPDMTCDHCKATVEAALSGVPGVRTVAVDLGGRRATVEGDAAVEALVIALDRAGYPARPAG
jgi:copper chaperone CopZ